VNKKIKQCETEQKQVERKHQKKNKLSIPAAVVTKAQNIHGNEVVTKTTTIRGTTTTAAYFLNRLIAT
jgi:hypothetical protein